MAIGIWMKILLISLVTVTCGAQEDVCLGQSLRKLCNRLNRIEAKLKVFSPKSIVANRDSLCKLGLKTHYIPDDAITASSHLDEGRTTLYHHKFGRLDEPHIPGINFGAWVAGRNRIGEWIQVNLGQKQRITGVVTQGRGDTNLNQWVTRYKVAFQAPRDERWKFVRDEESEPIMFSGNNDGAGKVTNIFPRPIVVVRLRLVVEEWHNFIALRHEYLTC